MIESRAGQNDFHSFSTVAVIKRLRGQFFVDEDPPGTLGTLVAADLPLGPTLPPPLITLWCRSISQVGGVGAMLACQWPKHPNDQALLFLPFYVSMYCCHGAFLVKCQ